MRSDVDMIVSSEDEDEAPPLAVPLQPTQHPLKPTLNAEQPEIDVADGAASTPPAPPVPVLLLTGYLGSGKTTLVNYILSAKHGYRCAVLMNEFGEDAADIEKALVREPEGDEAAPLADWVQLENGCICCSVKNDMVQALESLLKQRDKFDYVIIETTGLANPGPVAAALWTDEELESAICLDAIVTVVDAKNVRRHLHETRPDGSVNEAQQQVAFADVVLLNKTDLVDEVALEDVETDIAAVNSEAAIVRCERCVVDLGRVLHTGIYSGGAAAEENNEEADGGEGEHAQHADHDHEHGHNSSCGTTGCSHPSHAHSHDPAVRTVTLHVSRPLSLLRLRHWLDELLWGQDTAPSDSGEGPLRPDIFRVKGLLHVSGSDKKWVLQAVHELYDFVEGPDWEVGVPPRSKIVFIGRHLDGDKLQKEFDGCCEED